MRPDRGLRGLVWRGALVVSAAGMVLGGLLHAVGRQPLSASLVTAAFALALLAVPLGLLDSTPPEELCD